MTLPFYPIKKIEDIEPDATPELWDETYLEIDADLSSLDDRLTIVEKFQGGNVALIELTDVSVTSNPTDGAVLTYSEQLKKWVTTLPATQQSSGDKQIGVGQSWVNVASSRAIGTQYTNDTGKPIQVSISITGGSGGCQCDFYVDSIVISTIYGKIDNSIGTIFTIIPVGSTYKLRLVGGTVSNKKWSELR